MSENGPSANKKKDATAKGRTDRDLNTRKTSKSILAGVIVAVIAIALISAAIFTPGVLGLPTKTSSVNTSTSGQSTVNGSTASQSTSNSNTTTGTSQGQTNSGPTGTLAVLMTDPPTIPIGVTAVYINYSDVAVHLRDAGNETGWTNMQSSGEINLLSIINSTETIAANNITSVVFNALEFNITSALVTFQGTNYTADLVYQEHTLFVPIVGGITITSGQTSAVVIEMIPTVLLLGNVTNPTFAFIPEARGYTLPAQSVSSHPHKGDRDDDQGKIADQIQDRTHFEITSPSLTPNSLSVTVKNTGNSTVVFRFVALTATSTVSGGWVPSSPIGPISKISEFFVVASNGSLLALDSRNHQELDQSMDAGGNSLASGSNATYTFNQPVTIGALAIFQGQAPTQQVNPGEEYVMTVLGSGAFAQTVLIAGSSSTTFTTTSTPSITSTSTTISTGTTIVTSTTTSTRTTTSTLTATSTRTTIVTSTTTSATTSTTSSNAATSTTPSTSKTTSVSTSKTSTTSTTTTTTTSTTTMSRTISSTTSSSTTTSRSSSSTSSSTSTAS